jgi:hypothetical protein
VKTRLTMAGLLAALLAVLIPGVASAHTARWSPPRRALYYGMSGHDVHRLQDRLNWLHYYPGAEDGYFGAGTLEAVWAFQEVQGLPVTGIVADATERALVHPRTPRPLIPHGGPLRVEVDLGKHVLYVYHHNRIVLISHISSGGGYYFCVGGSCSYAITPTGDFHTLWRVHGWDVSPLGMLYNPVYFYRGYAIHGEPQVPLLPVSHGCVRIPMDVANVFPGLVPHAGIPVYIRW